MPVATAVDDSPPAVVPRYTLYDVAPELAVQESAAWALPAVAVKPVGAGGAGGTGVADASLDIPLVPAALTAATL